MDSKITAIKGQTKNLNRVNIFLDGEYAFSLAKIVAAWLAVGQTLDQQKIAQLQEEDTDEKAFQRALHFISYRPRSEKEVQKKLSSVGFEAAVIEKTIQKLIRGNLLGDETFSHMWVENRVLSSPRSRRALGYELRKKGIDDQVIENAISKIEDEGSLALRAAQKYSRRLASLSFIEFKKKMMGFLARRGFMYGDILEVISKVWNEMDQNS